jgi:hypothetical protein
MPKRSNFFQRLIFEIEQSLTDTSKTTITESALLKDQNTDEEREIDILIESEISGYPIRIAIECRNYRRKCNSTWIEQLIGKYQDLPVDKVIAVSRNGFYRPAIDKAQRYGIETFSLRQVSKTDWETLVSESKPSRGWTHSAVYWLAMSFHSMNPMNAKEHKELLDKIEKSDIWITDPEHKTQEVNLDDYEDVLIHDERIWEEIQNGVDRIAHSLPNQKAPSSINKIARVKSDIEYILLDSSGKEWLMDELAIIFQIHIIKSREEEFEYRGQKVSISDFKGEGEITDAPTGFVTFQPQRGESAPSQPIWTVKSVSSGEFKPLQLPLGMKQKTSEAPPQPPELIKQSTDKE